MSIYEYDEEKHMRQEREEARERLLLEQIQKKLVKGQTIPQIAEAIEESEETVRKLLQDADVQVQ